MNKDRETLLVNVKVKYIRPKYNNLKEWCEDPNNVYIGRKGVVFIKNEETGKKERYPKQDSKFANPFKLKKGTSRDQVTEKYNMYLRNKIRKEEITLEDLHNLKGKTLGCWCKPDKCHGDVLLEILKFID